MPAFPPGPGRRLAHRPVDEVRGGGDDGGPPASPAEPSSTARPARPVEVGVEHDGELRGEQSVGAQRFAGFRRVLGGDEIGVGTQRPPRRELQHLRAERCRHTMSGVHRRGGGVQRVEAGDHRAVRLRVLRHHRAVADTQAEDEAPAGVRVELRDANRHIRRGVVPDTEDPGGEGEGTGGVDEGGGVVGRALLPIQSVPYPRSSSSVTASVMAAFPASSARDRCRAPLQMPICPNAPRVSEVML